jgi:hypothetical protein
MIFAYVCCMRFYLWGLVVGILWAQLVWDWHAEQDQGSGYHIPAISSLPHSQLFYRVKLVGDTLWVMGNTCVRAGDKLYLPSTDGAKEVYHNLSPDPVAVSYIAGYDRITGVLKLVYLAHVDPSESYAIRFQDFAVSENQDTLWVAVDLPDAGGCRDRPGSGSISVSNGTIIVERWTSGTLFSVGWQTSFSYSLHFSASAGQVWQIIRGTNEVHCVPIHWQNNQTDRGLDLGFWSLVRRPGVVYVSGACRRPNRVESLDGYFSSQQLNNAFPLNRDVNSEPFYGFILRLSTGTSLGITHAAAIGRSPRQGPRRLPVFQTYRRSLILFGDTVFFLVGMRADGGSWTTDHTLYAKSSAGPASTLHLGELDSGDPRSGRVILVGFDADDLEPLLTQSGSLAYVRLWNYGGSSLQPPTLYPVVVGDTLYIAWSDGRPVGVPTGAGEVGFGSGWRIYVMGWAGLSTYGSSWSAFGAGWPASYPSSPGPLPGPASGMVRWGDTLWVSCTGGRDQPPLFLLHRQVGHPSFRFVRAVAPNSSLDTVEIGGLAIDGAGHLYAAGIIHGSFVYERVRPNATAVSITSLSRPHGVGRFGYGRGWVGRLLNYRYAAEGGIIPNRCVPDTVQHGNLSYVLWGHFSPGEKVVFTWEGSKAAWAGYGFLWRPGAVYTVSSDKPDSLHVALSWAAFPGWASGSYRLQPRLLVWERPDTLQLEGEPPLSLVSGGYTLPSLYRQDSTERWWVVPFIGDASKSNGWRSLGASFHRRDGYIDGDASLEPHYVFAYVPYHPFLQQEVVYVAVNYTDSVLLYRVEVATGQVYRERGWPRLSDHQPRYEVQPDTIVGGIQQLHYSASYGHLLAVEGAYRLRAIPLTDISHRSFLTHRQRTVGLQTYTQKPSLRSQPAVLTTDTSGRLLYWVREEVLQGGFPRGYSYSLLYKLPASPSGRPTVIHSVGQTNACMQDGLPYKIASIRAMVSVEDTVFFLDWGPYDGGGGCSSDSVLRLRKLSLGVGGEVQTLATFYNAGSVSVLDSFRLGLLYRPLPAPHLLIAVPMYEGGSGQRRDYLLRYWLDGRPKALDTILGRGSSTGCAYGLDKLVSLRWPHLISFDQNRSGLLLFSAEKEIRAALPLYINRQGEIDRTAWGTSQTIQAGQVVYPRNVAASSSGSMLSWAVDSLVSVVEDSLTLRVSVCSFSAEERHQTQHWFYRLPQFLFDVDGPSLVCQGQIFHGKVSFGGDDFLFWQNSQAGRPEACGGSALFDSVTVGVVPAGKVVELMRIQADDPRESALNPITVRYYAADSCSLCRYEGVVRGLVSGEDSAFFRAFLGRLSAGSDFEIRRGHQVRLRVAVEGPAARARRGLQRLAPHPLLRRRAIAYCIEEQASPLGDSLWIVPTRRSGNVERWRRMDNVRVSDDVAASPEAWQRPAWALPCRVEVREGGPDGPVTDDLWGLVDTLGWVWPLRAPLIDSTDSPAHLSRAYYRGRLLSFCRCDTNANKWIVVRFPNHIALRSAGPLSLSGNLLSNDPDNPVTIDLTDPTYLDGIPGYHYAIVPDSLNPGQVQAAAWAGNVDDCYGPHRRAYPGQDPPDCSRINAADWEMLLPRNGLYPGPVFTIGDLNGDGRVDAVDFTLLISNMNQLREGVVGD